MKVKAFLWRATVGACATAALGVASASEPVGKISRIEGVAVLTQGSQYVKGHEGMPLREGDRVLVMEGGNVLITFTDGCQYKLGDSEVLSIGAGSTCAAGKGGDYTASPNSAVADANALAEGTKAQNAAAGAVAAGAAGAGAMSAAVIVPAVVGIAAVGGAIAASNNNNNNNPSAPLTLSGPTTPISP